MGNNRRDAHQAGRGRRFDTGAELSERSEPILYNIAMVLYTGAVATMNVSEAREKFAEVIDAAQSEAVVLERYGQPAAVLVSMARYDRKAA